jgi:hypothetical protein
MVFPPIVTWAVVDDIYNAIKNLFQGWLNSFGDVLDNLGKAISSGASILGQALFFPIGLHGILNLFGLSGFTLAFFDLGKIVLGGIFNIIEGVWNGVLNIIMGLWNTIKDIWNRMAETINQWFTGLMIWIREKLKALLTANITIIGTWSRLKAFHKKPTAKNFYLIFTAGLGSYILGKIISEFVVTLIPVPSTRTFPLVPPLDLPELTLPELTLDRTPLQQELRQPTIPELFVKSYYHTSAYLNKFTKSVYHSYYNFSTYLSKFTKTVEATQSYYHFSTYLGKFTKTVETIQSYYHFSTYLSKFTKTVEAIQSYYHFSTYLSKFTKSGYQSEFTINNFASERTKTITQSMTADTIDITNFVPRASFEFITAESELLLPIVPLTINLTIKTLEDEIQYSPRVNMPATSVEIVV